MELTAERLKDYVVLIQHGQPEEKQVQTLKKIQSRVEKHLRRLADSRFIDDPPGQMLAAIRLIPLGEGFSVLSELTIRPDATDTQKEMATGLIPEVMDRARQIFARQVFTRIRKENHFPEYGKVLQKTLFRRIGERIEYMKPVRNLPFETGTVLKWKNIRETGQDLAVKLFGEVGRGAPDWDADDDPVQLLRTYFSEPGLTSGPDCIDIGYYNGVPVAFILCQVSPDDGWSRITFMGIIRQYRGKGLGKWVHRHGFQMIRNQGGKTYHGGCLARNLPMVALFNRHVGKEHSRVIEYVWKSPL